MHEPCKLYFTHIQSRCVTEMPWSYGVSVKHPYFALNYFSKVLPW